MLPNSDFRVFLLKDKKNTSHIILAFVITTSTLSITENLKVERGPVIELNT